MCRISVSLAFWSQSRISSSVTTIVEGRKDHVVCILHGYAGSNLRLKDTRRQVVDAHCNSRVPSQQSPTTYQVYQHAETKDCSCSKVLYHNSRTTLGFFFLWADIAAQADLKLNLGAARHPCVFPFIAGRILCFINPLEHQLIVNVQAAASLISLLNDCLLSKVKRPLGWLNPWLYVPPSSGGPR
jgi:hypothetical protein